MWSPKLGEKCKIKVSGLEGQIVGEHRSIDGETTFNVRYADKNGTVQSSWLFAGELDAAG